MIVYNIEQGSPEWFTLRCGKPTASNFDKIIQIDGKPSKQRTKYLYKLAGEQITRISEETYQNVAMLRGKDLEDEARTLYGLILGVDVTQIGFCQKDGYGSSPDGVISDDGILEIKCPILPTHVGYLIENKLPSEYYQQVQGNLLVTGRDWCDFMSYYPGMKPFIKRVTPDAKFQKMLHDELVKFCQELQDIVNKLK